MQETGEPQIVYRPEPRDADAVTDTSPKKKKIVHFVRDGGKDIKTSAGGIPIR